MSEQKKPLVLLVLDGYGHSDSNEFNAIQAAKTPVMDHLRSHCPTTLIATSGLAVGLPEGQMGNSEVGHMTLGAGRVIYQSFTRINKAIADGDFFANPTYSRAIDNAISGKNRVHILGLLSQGGVHSHEDHINAMVDMAAQRGAKEVYVHAFLDGRDTPPRSAEQSLQRTAAKLAELGVGRVASICGRFYAMDRDNRWDRVQAAYDLLTLGKAEHSAADPVEGLHAAYQRGENDEFVLPTLIADDLHPAVTIRDGDTVLFMNFRPDRAREMTRALVDKDFSGFSRTAHPALGAFVMTTEYAADIQADCAFPPEDLHNTLGEYLSNRGMTQLRIAETEKYAHVTFFFNGGQETLFRGEDRILIPSPKVATYDLKPEMSAYELTDELVKAITGCQYDVIICNYANCDQVGHSGVFDAAVKAVEVVDACLDRVLKAIRQTGGECLITADHGNVEQMFDKESGQVHTQHTTLPVPLTYVGQRALMLKENGSLADVAATLLDLLDLPPPPEMTGHSLVSFTR
ncbi:2,3-bisphosphoglycerate-independent phosphoglycerate mutase [uncultured Porticoccus sp.]|uniref:2,3-bisphosphoglycerate-independent phosphoglycerate mutase n=1 Tax=uncultured Porticoccus sp. TaxID=1256050 RepID=UPI00262B3D54|nr:2,3-bisphosphoglycerate-independent phosphoglycerate mutase [uncultured Porticoccus sp.]